MRDNPLNRLPADPAWVAKADALAEAAAKEMGCPVVLMAMQENGKVGICVAGAPETGDFGELLHDLPRLFRTTAAVCALNDAIEAQQDKH